MIGLSPRPVGSRKKNHRVNHNSAILAKIFKKINKTKLAVRQKNHCAALHRKMKSYGVIDSYVVRARRTNNEQFMG